MAASASISSATAPPTPPTHPPPLHSPFVSYMSLGTHSLVLHMPLWTHTYTPTRCFINMNTTTKICWMETWPSFAELYCPTKKNIVHLFFIDPRIGCFFSYLYTIHQTCMQQYTLHTQWSSCSGLSENSWSIGCTEGARHCSSLQNISRIFWAPVQSVQPAKSPSRTPHNPKSWAPKRAWEGLNLSSVQPEKASLKVRKPA